MRVSGKFYNFIVFLCLILGVKPNTVVPMIFTLIVTIPMITSNAYHISFLQFHLLLGPWGMIHNGDLLVLVLPAIVPNVIKRFEPICGIWMECLHNFVGNAAHLGAEGTYKVVGDGQQVNVRDYALQRFHGIPR